MIDPAIGDPDGGSLTVHETEIGRGVRIVQVHEPGRQQITVEIHHRIDIAHMDVGAGVIADPGDGRVLHEHRRREPFGHRVDVSGDEQGSHWIDSIESGHGR